MRVSVILGLGLALATSASFAQQPQKFQVKPSRIEGKKPARIAPMPKTANTASEAAKDLRRIEQESAKASANVKPTGQKSASASAALFKPEKSRPVPPINASGSGGMGTNTKGLGMTNQGKNPYKGRLRQKGSHQ